MSGDHNMNQTDSGWRKRQIALNKKAENARELGLDYEPVTENFMDALKYDVARRDSEFDTRIERFAELVRADEREACAKVCDRVIEGKDPDDIHSDSQWAALTLAAEIRARGQA